MEKAQEHHDHVIPVSLLLKTLVMLAFLMTLTIVVYKIDFGHIISSKVGLGSAAGSYINNAIALTIAMIKAYFVVMNFMGARFVTPLTKMWVACGFVWVLLMGLMFGDYWTRHWEPSPGWYKGDTAHPNRESATTERPREIKSKAEGH